MRLQGGARGRGPRGCSQLVEDQGWFFDTELLVLAEHNGLRIHEVPVDWVDDPVSRVDIVRTAVDDLRGVWRMIRRFARGDGELASARAAAGTTPGTAPAIDPRLGPQVVKFASIGVVSTVVFAALFAVLDGPLGPVPGRRVVALLVCVREHRGQPSPRRSHCEVAGSVRHYAAGTFLGLLPLGLTLTALGALAALDVSSLRVTLVTLTAANLLATHSVRPSAPAQLGVPPVKPAGPPETGEPGIAQWLRYGTVSLVATATSLAVLGILVSTTSMPAGVANVIATAVGTVPSFELNRWWVWQRTGPRSVRNQLVPFWLLSLAGLALSTLAVSLTAVGRAPPGSTAAQKHTAAIEAANLAAWGSLWVAQFLVLDRLLFRPSQISAAPVDPHLPPHRRGPPDDEHHPRSRSRPDQPPFPRRARDAGASRRRPSRREPQPARRAPSLRARS